ncbi:helix-turn-helix domain-containing protein [Halobium salinum]|uniref:Helix-turn-helix domain-containing protein n=1 Tax=Halobium salinum TaxID=1364940 RepID=A0ABD5PFB9_9EURY|nr:helix-turn-helix domain-containing protein [Halobium salinum]
MSTIAEVELAADEFALAETLRAHPDTEFEVVRMAAHDQDHIMPYVRVSGDAISGVEDSLNADPSVDQLRLLDDLEDEQLYRMHWVADIQTVLHMVLDEEATVVEMHGHGDRWFLRVLFPDREALSATHDFCTENDLTFTIRNIHDLQGSVGRGEFGLTREQYEALVRAAERGYFDVPRGVTMGELAEELGVSQQALSERLRRGHKSLINSALRVEESPMTQ